MSMVSHFVARAGLVTSLVFVSSGGVNPDEMPDEPSKRSQATLAPAPLRHGARQNAKPPPVPLKSTPAVPMDVEDGHGGPSPTFHNMGTEKSYLGPDGQPPLPLMSVDLARNNPGITRIREGNEGRYSPRHTSLTSRHSPLITPQKGDASAAGGVPRNIFLIISP